MGWGGTLIMLALAMGVIYFIILRPQNKVRQQHSDFMSQLKRGKRVVTIGGLHGTIVEIDEKQVQLLVAPKIVLTFRRDAISMEFTNALSAAADANNNAAATTPVAPLTGSSEGNA